MTTKRELALRFAVGDRVLWNPGRLRNVKATVLRVRSKSVVIRADGIEGEHHVNPRRLLHLKVDVYRKRAIANEAHAETAHVYAIEVGRSLNDAILRDIQTKVVR